MKTAAHDKAYGAANMTANKQLQFQIRLSNAVTEAKPWSLADTERVTIQLEREIYGITSNDQKQFKKEFSVHMIEFYPWWEIIGIQALRKTTKRRIIHFRYQKLHPVSHVSDRICRIGSGHNFTTDICEQLYIATMKEHINLERKSITVDKCLSVMTGVPVSIIWRRHCHILHFKADMMLSLQKLSTYCPLLIHGKVDAEPICYVWKQFRPSLSSALYHSRYIISEKRMSA